MLSIVMQVFLWAGVLLVFLPAVFAIPRIAPWLIRWEMPGVRVMDRAESLSIRKGWERRFFERMYYFEDNPWIVSATGAAVLMFDLVLAILF